MIRKHICQTKLLSPQELLFILTQNKKNENQNHKTKRIKINEIRKSNILYRQFLI